jgi:hypothetical protein
LENFLIHQTLLLHAQFGALGQFFQHQVQECQHLVALEFRDKLKTVACNHCNWFIC